MGFLYVRVGQSSLCRQVLLQPLGVSRMPHASHGVFPKTNPITPLQFCCNDHDPSAAYKPSTTLAYP